MCMQVCYQINLRFLDSVNNFSLVCCKILDIDVNNNSANYCQSTNQVERDQILIKLQQLLVHLEILVLNLLSREDNKQKSDT